MSHFGCFTGDCPHMDKAGCYVAIEAHVTALEDESARLHEHIARDADGDSNLDLIHANREATLHVYEKVVSFVIEDERKHGISPRTSDFLKQAQAFHPMHPDTYPECLRARCAAPPEGEGREILPCPHCGNEADCRENREPAVWCPACYMEGPLCDDALPLDEGRASAIKKWNALPRRVPAPSESEPPLLEHAVAPRVSADEDPGRPAHMPDPDRGSHPNWDAEPPCGTCGGSGEIEEDGPKSWAHLGGDRWASSETYPEGEFSPCPDCSPEPAPQDPWERAASHLESLSDALGNLHGEARDALVGIAAEVRSLPRPQGGASPEERALREFVESQRKMAELPEDVRELREILNAAFVALDPDRPALMSLPARCAELRADLEALRARPQIGEEVAATALRFAEQIEQCGGLLAFKDYRDSWAPWLRSLAARLAPEDQDAS